MGANKKKKTAATVGAVSLVAALVLTGTYAWNSISQKAKNENTVYANPGGRLHDDWNGSDPKKGIKRVYVENFTKETYTDAKDGTVQNDPNAAAIYVRVKLQTYMEYGEEAGKVDAQGIPVSGRNAKPLVTGSDMGDTDTWPVYIYGQSSAFQSYFDLKTQLNEKLKYMPTFNKNKESLLADINGTYEGTTTGDSTYFDDFKDYGTATTPGADGTASQTNPAYYYLKDGTSPANTTPGDETKHIKNANETHAVSETLATEKIITMEEWLNYDGTTSGQEKTGNYWIYDEDGWAYWANPVEPGTATGPLLTDVKMKNSLGGNCYYAINVTGEFASAGDWGKVDGATDKELGFYKNGITDHALTLLDTIAKTIGADWVNITASSADAAANTVDSISVEPGATIEFTGNVMLEGERVSNQEITWALDGVEARNVTSTFTTTRDGATLEIPEETQPRTLTVTATPKANPNVVATYKVKVIAPNTIKIKNTGNVDRIAMGQSLQFSAEVLRGAKKYSNQKVLWSVDGSKSPTGGTLFVASDEVGGTILTITAKSILDESVVGEVEIRASKSSLDMNILKSIDQVAVTTSGVLAGSKIGPVDTILGDRNNTRTIEIDGVPFFIIAKKDGKALLLTEEKVKESVFYDVATGTADSPEKYNRWKYSTIRTWLNDDWLADKPLLSSVALETELVTPQENDSTTDQVDTTIDKMFFLSEPDIFGTSGDLDKNEIPAQYYTVTKGAEGVRLVAPNGSWISKYTLSSDRWWRLRTPRMNGDALSDVTNDGTNGGAPYSWTNGGARPACWIDL